MDNTTLVPRGSSGHDRLGIVRPIILHLSTKFLQLYDPHRDVSVDEADDKFQGWSSLKQYLPMKPIKRGIKVCVFTCICNVGVYMYYTCRYGYRL